MSNLIELFAPIAGLYFILILFITICIAHVAATEINIAARYLVQFRRSRYVPSDQLGHVHLMPHDNS